MKDTWLAERIPILYGALELSFACINGWAAIQVAGLEPVTATVLFAFFLVLRLTAFWWVHRRLVEPSLRVQRRVDQGRPVSDAELTSADAKLSDATTIGTLVPAAGWALTYPLTIAAHVLLVGPSEFDQWMIPIVVLLSVQSASGAIAIARPLLGWSYAAPAGRNHLLAGQRNLDLERSPRSLTVSIAVITLCIATATATMLASSGLSAQVQAANDAAYRETTLLATTLAHRAAEGDAFRAQNELAGENALGETTLFALPPSADPQFAGAPAPAWATPELLEGASKKASTARIEGSTIRAVALDDGMVVGAICHRASISSSYLTLVAASLATVILFALVTAWLLSRSVSLPLERTARFAARAAREGDLSRMGALPVGELNEVGMTTLNLNELLERMRSVAVAAKEIGEGNLQVKLQSNGELPDAFRAMLKQLRELVGEMQTTATELANASTEIAAASQEQEAAVTTQSAGMTEVSQTMESLSASAAHVASAVHGVLENAERSLKNTDQMIGRIDELTGHANRIGGLLDVIREIADRTDLLALNGSLEASRAGEAGLGFSLVAAEMRRLAERVTGSTADIKTLVSDIHESGASTVVATEESKKLAESTAQAARSITSVTLQQQTSTEQVTLSVRTVAEVVQQAAVSTSQTRASAKTLNEQATRLASLVDRFQLDG